MSCDEILTLKELASYLQVHVSTIYRHAKKGNIPHFRIGNSFRFSLKTIDEWRLRLDKIPTEIISNDKSRKRVGDGCSKQRKIDNDIRTNA